jgi:hypothetical protein
MEGRKEWSLSFFSTVSMDIASIQSIPLPLIDASLRCILQNFFGIINSQHIGLAKDQMEKAPFHRV